MAKLDYIHPPTETPLQDNSAQCSPLSNRATHITHTNIV